MRLTTLAMFGAGYLVGTRAGRERYEQIVIAAEKASKRLEDFSARRLEDFSARHRMDSPDGGRDPGRREPAF